LRPFLEILWRGGGMTPAVQKDAEKSVSSMV
jgi:hypothetical protein